MKPTLLVTLVSGFIAAFSGTLHAQSGEVVYYGANGEHIPATMKAFNALYPNIRFKAVTGDAGQLRTRMAAEKDNPQGDVFYGDTEHFINRRELFKPYRSKHLAAFPDWALVKHGEDIYAYGYAISFQVFAVNSQKMALADAPKSWQDLTKPQYQGKIMVGNPALSGGGYYSFFQFLQMYGWDAVDKYVENARFQASTGAVPANVGRGEVAVGLTEETMAWDLAEKGFPVSVIYPEEGVVPTLNAIGLIRNSPNPENAILLAEFMNSVEGNNINVATRNRRSPRADADRPKGLAPIAELKVNTSPKINVPESIAKKSEYLKGFDEVLQRKGKKTEGGS
jgi:iron(III) transport system substrate-binding protein